MIPRECKRLAEVDFPIAVVSAHAVAEKGIRQGLPTHLHAWWARRPLASSRAMLLALAIPDPCDALCPAEFKADARKALETVKKVGSSDLELRRALLEFIGDIASLERASHLRLLEVARGLVRAAYPEGPPVVLDTFAGGGSIPYEALRLGCEPIASDLNPVACLILRVLLEELPRHGPDLLDELKRIGGEIGASAKRDLGDLYPDEPDGARPIAYIWARTIRCDSIDCGAEIPLMRSFWLSKRGRKKRALRFRGHRRKGIDPEFEIFEPATDLEVPRATISGGKATCPACQITMPAERARAQLSDQRGGADIQFDEAGQRIGGARFDRCCHGRSRRTRAQLPAPRST